MKIDVLISRYFQENGKCVHKVSDELSKWFMRKWEQEKMV